MSHLAGPCIQTSLAKIFQLGASIIYVSMISFPLAFSATSMIGPTSLYICKDWGFEEEDVIHYCWSIILEGICELQVCNFHLDFCIVRVPLV